MPRASLIALRRSVGMLIAIVLLCGCEPSTSPPEQTREQRSAPSASESVRDSSALAGVAEERERLARIARLSAEIEAAMAQRTELQQQRAAIDARLVEHEEQGRVLLDTLKAQMQERTGQGRDDAAFKTEARAKLEATLAQDDALTSSLQELDTRIAATNATIDALSAERKQLEEGTRQPVPLGEE